MVQAKPSARAGARPAVVPLPAEIDVANAERVAADLRAAFAAPGVTVVVADMTATTFCDLLGARALLRAHQHATGSGAELRLVVPSARVVRVLAVLSLDRLLAIYPSLPAALPAEPAAELAAEPAAEPAVVRFPAELDIGRAGEVAGQLRAAIVPAAGAVVADLSTTVFRDPSGVRVILLARDWAVADDVELRLVVPPGPTLVLLKRIGLHELVPVYPGLAEALAGERAPDAGAPG
jgi:anti-sigma B factor antagonist